MTMTTNKLTRRQAEVLGILVDRKKTIDWNRGGVWTIGGLYDGVCVEVAPRTVHALDKVGMIEDILGYCVAKRYAITKAGRAFLETNGS